MYNIQYLFFCASRTSLTTRNFKRFQIKHNEIIVNDISDELGLPAKLNQTLKTNSCINNAQKARLTIVEHKL